MLHRTLALLDGKHGLMDYIKSFQAGVAISILHDHKARGVFMVFGLLGSM